MPKTNDSPTNDHDALKARGLLRAAANPPTDESEKSMKARLIQLFARYIGVALASVATWIGVEVDPEQTQQLAVAAATAIAAVIAFVADLLIHRASTGSIITPITKSAPLVLLVLMLSACATPTERWVAQREAVTTAQTILPQLVAQRVIAEDDLDDLVPLIWTARDLVNVSYAYLPQGGPAFETNLTTAADSLARLRELLRNKQEP